MNISSLVIRKPHPEEAPELSRLARSTFDETFSPTNSAENMRAYMDANFFPERQLEEILDPRRTIYVAFENKRAVGYVSVVESPPEKCIVLRPALELQRLYVDSSWHGRGLALELMNRAKDRAIEFKAKSLWLGVWENNLRAQKFYLKAGFIKAGSHPFLMGSEAQTDFIFEYLVPN